MVKLYYKSNCRGRIDYSSAWLDMMIECLCVGGEFNTYRMLDQYKHAIWKIARKTFKYCFSRGTVDNKIVML